jgi:hypothetical protein
MSQKTYNALGEIGTEDAEEHMWWPKNFTLALRVFSLRR